MSGKIAIFGGSFDPPHLGHVLAVAWALSTGAVQRVWVFPVFKHRFDKRPGPFAARLRWCQEAFGLFGDRVVVRDDERTVVQGGGSGATIELVEYLHRQSSQHRPDFCLLVGSDQLANLHRWHRWEALAALAPPLVIGRCGHGDEGSAITLPDISSTAIRAALAEGVVPRQWLPAAVADLLELSV